jgi:S1-C subfamily serine protease
MPARLQLEKIKRATVAVALMPDAQPANPKVAPFTILGSGFCIDASGIIVTCEHVVAAFSKQDVRQAIADVPPEQRSQPVWPLKGLQADRPYVLFYAPEPNGENLLVIPAPVTLAVAKLEYDLGLMRIGPHAAFPNGYPQLEVEEFSEIHEGMEVATCGFPMGNELHEQLGTRTSSFTKGILSSIAPAAGAAPELVSGYQLDLTATFGNSGGPVFSWATGRVIGVLQGGPVQRSGTPLPGIAHAESLHRIIRDGTLDRFKAKKTTDRLEDA